MHTTIDCIVFYFVNMMVNITGTEFILNIIIIIIMILSDLTIIWEEKDQVLTISNAKTIDDIVGADG